jgi:hypothetical protein
MGLRLTYRLSAQGSTAHAHAAGLLDLLRVLREHRLLAEGASRVGIETQGPAKSFASVPVGELSSLIGQLELQSYETISVQGLRTIDQHPNLFWEYTADERSLGAFVTLRATRASAGRSARVEVTYSEVDFNDTQPLLPASLLKRALDEAAGAFLMAGCYLDEPSEAAS